MSKIWPTYHPYCTSTDDHTITFVSLSKKNIRAYGDKWTERSIEMKIEYISII